MFTLQCSYPTAGHSHFSNTATTVSSITHNHIALMWNSSTSHYTLTRCWWWWWLFPRLREFGGECSTIISSLRFFFFFFKVDSSPRVLMSASAKRREITPQLFAARGRTQERTVAACPTQPRVLFSCPPASAF